MVLLRDSRIDLEARDGRVRVWRSRAALAAGAATGLAVSVCVAPRAAPDLAVVVIRQENCRRRVGRRQRKTARLGLIELDGGEKCSVDLVAAVIVQGHKGTESVSHVSERRRAKVKERLTRRRAWREGRKRRW